MTEHVAPQGNTDAAISFLRKIRGDGPWVLAAIDPAGGAPIVATFAGPGRIPAMRAWIDRFNGRLNLYFLPNRTKRPVAKKPREVDISSVDYAFVDIDPVAGETPEQCQKRGQKLLNALPHPPTLSWCTGNGMQAAWRFDDHMAIESVEDVATCKEINIGLIKALGGKAAGIDSCQNLDRVLRLPGTVNIPDAKKRAKGRRASLAREVTYHPDRVYAPFELPSEKLASPVETSSCLIGDPESVEDLSKLDLPDRIAEIVKDGRVAGEKKENDDSRSAWEAEAIFGMFRADLSNETILGILINPEFRISDRILARGNSTEYARKSIERLRRRYNADIADDFSDDLNADADSTDDFREFTADSFEGKEVPLQGWIAEDLIVANDVTLGMGDGGTGKTTLMLQLSVAVASGQQWLGRDVAKGKAIYLSGEESRDVIHRRLNDIINGASSPYTSPRVTWVDLAGLKIIDRSEQDALLATQHRETHRVTATALYRVVEQKVKEWGPAIVVIDSLYDVFGGDENAKAQVKQFVNLLRRLARRNSTAVIIVAHPSLSGMSTGSGTSGSTAWNNAVRSRFYLTGVKDRGGKARFPDMRQLKSMKQNYGRPDMVIDLVWENGIYLPVTEDEATKKAASALAKETFLQMLDQYNGEGRAVSHKPGPSYAPTIFASDHRNAGFDKHMFKDAMDMLLGDKAIKSETFGPPSKERTRLVRLDCS